MIQSAQPFGHYLTDHWTERYSASAVTWGMVMTESHHDRSLVILG